MMSVEGGTGVEECAEKDRVTSYDNEIEKGTKTMQRGGVGRAASEKGAMQKGWLWGVS